MELQTPPVLEGGQHVAVRFREVIGMQKNNVGRAGAKRLR
jgi:hypothetical protein